MLMYKQIFALNNLQWLIWHKRQPSKQLHVWTPEKTDFFLVL